MLQFKSQTIDAEVSIGHHAACTLEEVMSNGKFAIFNPLDEGRANGTYERASATGVVTQPFAKRKMQVVKSAGIALAWYLASSAAAVAVSSATGGAVTRAPPPKRKYTALPILLIAYALSRKDVKERTRCAGALAGLLACWLAGAVVCQLVHATSAVLCLSMLTVLN